MAYSKKINYPSFKKPGVYPSGSLKELGLDSDNLEKFSLGNWNSLFRGNKLILGGDLLSNIQGEDIEVKVRTSPPKDGTRVLVWRYQQDEDGNVLKAQGPIIEYLSDRENRGDNTNLDTAGVKRSRLIRTYSVYKQFYGDDNALISNSDKRTAFNFNGLNTNKVLTFENDEGTISTDNGEDIILKINENSRDKLQYHVFERELSDGEINNWGSGAPSSGNDQNFNHELIVLVEFDIQAKNLTTDDLETFENTEFSLNEYGDAEQYSIDSMTINGPTSDGLLGNLDNKSWWEYGKDGNSWNNYRLDYPRDSVASITLRGLEYNLYTGPKLNAKDDIPFRASTNRDEYYDGSGIGRELFLGSPYNGGYGYYRTAGNYGANITAIEFDSGYDVRPLIGTETGVRAFEWPEEFRFSISQTREIGNRDVEPARPLNQNYDISYSPLRGTDNPVYPPLLDSNIIELWDQHFSFLGYPDFEFDVTISDLEVLSNLKTFDTPIDFIINVKSDGGDDFLYYDNKDKPEKYRNTSFPMRVTLNIDLYDKDSEFTNTLEQNYDEDDLRTVFSAEGSALRDYLNQVFNVEDNAENPSNCYYKYEVIQWGDEDTLLSDGEIQNTYFFNFYDSDDDFDLNNFYFKKYQQAQEVRAKPIIRSFLPKTSNHIYNTSGVKTIKIIVYRYTKNGAFILQTYLVTKNIVVNDGNLLSQDFSIFGGTDFNFLPLSNAEAIIGGLDENSNYNNSVEKIKKDDNFVQDDYLERVSSRDFIDNFNNGLFGKSPGQLDLSTTRVFKKSLDIYDFITDDKQSIVDNDFNINTLPINSSATDIFISNEDCIIDLNAQDIDYLSIQNKTGTEDKAILIGDYKINQPQDGKIQREGVMKTPTLEDNQDKQAF